MAAHERHIDRIGFSLDDRISDFIRLVSTHGLTPRVKTNSANIASKQ